MLFRKIGLILIFIVCSLQAIDLQDVSKSALKEHKLILLSVESENCRYCEKMNKEVFTPPINAAKISKHYVQSIVNIADIKLPSSIKNVQYFPSNYILDPKTMKIIDEFPGYMKADEFISLLDLIYEQEAAN